MLSKFGHFGRLVTAGIVLLCGCHAPKSRTDFCISDFCHAPPNAPTSSASQLRLASACLSQNCGHGLPEMVSPLDIHEASLSSDRILNLTLEECVQQSLASSKVIRDLGGTIVRSPQTTMTTLDPALIFTDPRNGEEAALSAFDANLFISNFFENNNRRFNNQFLGVNGDFEQALNTTQAGVSKRSATGGLFTFRNVTIGDNNNQAGNALGRQSWDSFFEAEIRQPLLQGAGTEFNRIAGPGAFPGQLNGVLLARTRTDITLIDFERSVRDLVAEVENAYWDLYYAYRDLEAKIDLRNIAEETLQKIKARDDSGEGDIAQAEEQVHRFQAEVVDALNGRVLDGTRTYNGSSAGTFRGIGGVRMAERKLRLMIGLPINDGMLIRPSDSPSAVPVVFDWENAIGDALRGREELKRQRWVIKQAELELVANRNFLKPQLDVIGRYRARGFGDQLLSNQDGSSFFDNDLQEWQAGLEYSMPVGFRRAHAAVRNSELALVRANEILREQERVVHVGLSNALTESKRAFENMNLQRLRLDAIVTQLNALESRQQSGNTPELDVLLETHRRLLDARLRYHQAHIEYSLSLRNVHYEKGTLLAYNNVYLAESVTNQKALIDASERAEYLRADYQPAAVDPVIAR
jgi:outer membrane protein TolC